MTAAHREAPGRAENMLRRIPTGSWGDQRTVPERSFSRIAASAYLTGTVVPVDGGWLSR